MSKINGKFYPLQHQEWLRACKELKPAERDVLYFIRTLDPRNDGLDISASAIASDLSTPEKKVHRQTISRALKRLDELGFIELEIVTAKVNIKPKGLWCDQTPMVRTDTNGVYRHHDGSVDTTVDRYTPDAIATHQVRIATHPAEIPELLQCKDSSDFAKTQTYKTYKDFKDSLSDCEREGFENFCRTQTALLPRPIISLGDYLAAPDASGQPRYLDFYQRFTSSAVGQQIQQEKNEAALTKELIEQWEAEFDALDNDHRDFLASYQPESPEWNLRRQFLSIWDKHRAERERAFLSQLSPQDLELFAKGIIQLPSPKCILTTSPN